ALERGSERQRLGAIIVEGELGGSSQALHRLKIAKQSEPNQDAEVLSRLYSDYEDKHWDAPSVTPSERVALRRDLGWYGDLALAPAEGPDQQARQAVLEPARRTLFIAIAFVSGGLALAGIGAIALTALVIAWATGRVRGGITVGQSRATIW